MEELFLSDLRLVLDGDATLQGLRHGAAPFEDGEGAFGLLALARWDLHVVFDVDVGDLEHAFGRGDGAFRFSPEFVGVTGYPTRFQRAGEGAGESAGGGRDQVVEG